MAGWKIDPKLVTKADLGLIQVLLEKGKTNKQVLKALKQRGSKKTNGCEFYVCDISRVAIDILGVRRKAGYRRKGNKVTSNKVIETSEMDSLTLIEDIVTSNLGRDVKKALINKMVIA